MSEPVRMAGTSTVQVRAAGVAIAKGGEAQQNAAASVKAGGERVAALPDPVLHPLDTFEKAANLPGPLPRPGGPVPDEHKLTAVPLYDLQQSLRGGASGLGATPINIPNVPDGAGAGPKPLPDPVPDRGIFNPIGLRAEQDVPPTPPPPPPEPEPPNPPDGRIFHSTVLKSVQDVEGGPQPDPEPDPGPDPISVGGLIANPIGLRADQDVPPTPDPEPDPDPGPDPIPDGKILLGNLMNVSYKSPTVNDPATGLDAKTGLKR